MQTLDSQTCREARLSRDARFDGEFFLAVTSTGIYCRPVCPARPPRERNVRYYRTAAEASQQGFRPCLRCRPESAPASPAWRGTTTTVQRAMQLINEGALNQGSLEQLAARLGVGERYLRKLFREQVGASPSAVAQTQRLHFAQKLLMETQLSVTDIGYACGFGSTRRFNSATREKFGCTPGELRRNKGSAGKEPGEIKLELCYRPPYDWQGMQAFYTRHAIAGLESVDKNQYQRNIEIQGQAGVIRVSQHASRNALVLQLQLPDSSKLVPVVERVRRMFDLDANPERIAETLCEDQLLAKLHQQAPGIRLPMHWSGFESCVRGVVGQQVSVAAARKVCARLVEYCDNRTTLAGESVLLFPTAQQILELDDAQLPMPGSRKRTLRTVCEFFAGSGDAVDEDPGADFLALRGIGPWTAAMVSMRGYGNPDVFPPKDLGLIRAAQAQENGRKSDIEQRLENWRPWRSYAANLLWRSLGA